MDECVSACVCECESVKVERFNTNTQKKVQTQQGGAPLTGVVTPEAGQRNPSVGFSGRV